MTLLLVVLAAVAAAGVSYLVLEGLGRRGLLPGGLRAVALAALGLLVVNASCPTPPVALRPIALLDASLSMQSAGGRWVEARRLADSLGEVRPFGSERAGRDSGAVLGRSDLAPALVAAAATGRPVVVITDGEIGDAPDLPPDLARAAGVRLLPRAASADRSVVRADAPGRLTVGDTLEVDLELRATAGAADSGAVELRLDDPSRRVLARRTVRLAGGTGRTLLRVPTAGLPAGEHLLELALVGADAEPRDDRRLLHVTLDATPGIVLLAAPGDWDARFLARTMREVTALPTRGYVRFGTQWRRMDDLRPVAEADVREAARQADVLVLKGGTSGYADGSRARGLWRWPSGTGGTAVDAADWYAALGGASPLAAALGGLPVDSFAPGIALSELDPGPGDWIGLTVQASRRGVPRPAMIGRDAGRRRIAETGLDGLWRWAFRGGSSEQGYRALVASTVTWLLGAPDSAGGVARPVRRVVPNGRPVVFEWRGAGEPRAVALSVQGAAPAARADTLRFDGSGHAELWLAPGEYRYRLAEGGEGRIAVEEWSEEWLPRPVVLADQPMGSGAAGGRRGVRDWPWLFALAVAAFCGEWIVRRRLGLR